jgi:hypothetical protein
MFSILFSVNFVNANAVIDFYQYESLGRMAKNFFNFEIPIFNDSKGEGSYVGSIPSGGLVEIVKIDNKTQRAYFKKIGENICGDYFPTKFLTLIDGQNEPYKATVSSFLHKGASVSVVKDELWNDSFIRKESTVFLERIGEKFEVSILGFAADFVTVLYKEDCKNSIHFIDRYHLDFSQCANNLLIANESKKRQQQIPAPKGLSFDSLSFGGTFISKFSTFYQSNELNLHILNEFYFRGERFSDEFYAREVFIPDNKMGDANFIEEELDYVWHLIRNSKFYYFISESLGRNGGTSLFIVSDRIQ